MIFTKKDIYSPKLVVALYQVFPNLFPCVYILFIIFALLADFMPTKISVLEIHVTRITMTDNAKMANVSVKNLPEMIE